MIFSFGETFQRKIIPTALFLGSVVPEVKSEELKPLKELKSVSIQIRLGDLTQNAIVHASSKYEILIRIQCHHVFVHFRHSEHHRFCTIVEERVQS